MAEPDPEGSPHRLSGNAPSEVGGALHLRVHFSRDRRISWGGVMPPKSRTRLTPARLAIAEKENRALEMRLAGASWKAIADQLGWKTPGAALRAVQRVMNETKMEASGQLRQMEVMRLDRMMTALWPQALAGKWLAVDRILRIQERKAALLGLDAPQKRIVEHWTPEVFAEALGAQREQIAQLEAATAGTTLAEGVDFELLESEVEEEVSLTEAHIQEAEVVVQTSPAD